MVEINRNKNIFVLVDAKLSKFQRDKTDGGDDGKFDGGRGFDGPTRRNLQRPRTPDVQTPPPHFHQTHKSPGGTSIILSSMGAKLVTRCISTVFDATRMANYAKMANTKRIYS